MPPRIFLRSGPAFAEPRPAPPPAIATHSVGGPTAAALDAVLSEIDAEASSRSLTAVERAADDRGPDIGTSRAALSTSAAHLNFGSLVPRAAPTLYIPSRAQARAFEGLAVDPVARSPIPARPVTFRQTRQSEGGSLLRRIGRVAAWVVAGWLALVLLLMITYRFINPPASMLMLEHWLLGEKVVNSWVPLENMSPNIIRAVISSEDARFCEHHGVDFGALKEAVEEVGSGSARGASTISMQVVKNLFLWPSKSYVRKAIELPLTFVMELIWPKRRIMEVYLNIAEWGPGIFGIESAARFRFNKSARSLSAGQASRLAVALPNPLARNPARPGPGLQRLARAVQVRMRIAPSSRTSCILPSRRNR
jgi:monofunctional biosynthetic peptidoglycan transglycosylase